MMRNPLRSVAGRSAATADINRVVNGIALSLRQFSSAQRLQADNDQNDKPSRPKVRSVRERAAAAFGDLVSMGKEPAKDQSSPFKSSGPDTTASSPASPKATGVATGNSQRQDTAGDSGLRDAFSRLSENLSDNQFHKAAPPNAPNVIRGGIRGGLRGRFTGRGGAAARGTGGRQQAGRSSGRGGAKGGGKKGKRGRSAIKNKMKKAAETTDDGWVHPETAKFRAEIEQGRTRAYDPTITVDSLTGHGPVVAASFSPMAQKETVRRQTVMLGDGMPHHSHHMPDPVLALKAYKGQGRDGGYGRQDGPAAVYFPRGEETGAALRYWANDKVKFNSLPADGPTAKAILESSLLGRYDSEAPKHVPTTDVIGTVRSVLRRDGTWNTVAQRALEEKVLSLLPKQANTPPPPPPPPSKAKAAAPKTQKQTS